MANDVMIEVKGLTKFFGSFRALDRVSFDVRRGEVVGFLGPNGAGKSTTMRILSCFISATSGLAKVHGLDTFDEPLAVRHKLGYLPQRAPLYGEMSVIDYLRFCADVRGLDSGTFRTRMKTIVDVCGLARVLGRDIRTLSHGYRQRVGLGQALVHDPPILILDEPTSDLDPNERAEVIRYIQETGKNRTILLSTHNLNEVEAVCKRAIIVSKGRVVADGPLQQIKSISGKVRYLVAIDGRKVSTTSASYRTVAKPPTAQECHGELRAIQGISNVRETLSESGIHRFELRGPEKTDLRGEIYQLAQQKGWILLEIRREAESLDEAFKALTKDDERADRGRLARELDEAFSADDEDEDEDEDEDDEEEEQDENDRTKSAPARADDDEDDDEDEEDDEDDDAATAKPGAVAAKPVIPATKPLTPPAKPAPSKAEDEEEEEDDEEEDEDDEEEDEQDEDEDDEEEDEDDEEAEEDEPAAKKPEPAKKPASPSTVTPSKIKKDGR